MFFLSSPPAVPGIGVRCPVCSLWVNLVKVRPQVRHLQASCCFPENALWLWERMSDDTLAAGYELVTILHYTKKNKGPDPSLHLNTNEYCPVSAVLTGLKDTV